MRLPKDRPLTLEDFQGVEKGAMFTLRYHTHNRGEMIWIHDRVEGDRVWGQFPHNNGLPVEVGGYLYEYGGYVCCGSGAEPVWAGPPLYRGTLEDPMAEDDGGCYANCEECLDSEGSIG